MEELRGKYLPLDLDHRLRGMVRVVRKVDLRRRKRKDRLELNRHSICKERGSGQAGDGRCKEGRTP